MEIRNDSHHPHCKIPPGVRSFVAIGEKKIPNKKRNVHYLDVLSHREDNDEVSTWFSSRLQKV